MSGRCKACNVILDEFEMTRKWPGSSDYCELCTHCLNVSDDGSESLDIVDDSFDEEFDYEEWQDE